MSFHPFKVSSKPAGGGTGVTASLKQVRNAQAKLSFTFSAELVQTLGWSNGDLLEVLIGDGEHHGLVRLRKNNSVGTAAVSQRRAMKDSVWFAVALGHVPAFVNRSESKKHCQHEVVDSGWLEVVLPSWADETGTVKRAIPAIPTPPNLIRRPAKDVAPNLMGDSPRGRSALDQRK